MIPSWRSLFQIPHSLPILVKYNLKLFDAGANRSMVDHDVWVAPLDAFSVSKRLCLLFRFILIGGSIQKVTWSVLIFLTTLILISLSCHSCWFLVPWWLQEMHSWLSCFHRLWSFRQFFLQWSIINLASLSCTRSHMHSILALPFLSER